MTRENFVRKMTEAAAQSKSTCRPDYHRGYRRGLKRCYYGEDFGTAEDHQEWLKLIADPHKKWQEMGQGYRDGLAGLDPTPG